MMRNSRDWLGQPGTPPARWCHGARSRERRADVGVKPLETRPHHVSGARRVAAPVPRRRAGTRTQSNSVPSTRSNWREEKLCGKSMSDHTECGDERWQQVATRNSRKRKVRAEPTAGRRKGIQLSARRRCQAQWYVKLSSSRNSTCDDAAERRQTEPR